MPSGSAARPGTARGVGVPAPGGRKVGENKLLSKSARFSPLDAKCKLCKQRVSQERAAYCQGTSYFSRSVRVQKRAVCYLWQTDPGYLALQAVFIVYPLFPLIHDGALDNLRDAARATPTFLRARYARSGGGCITWAAQKTREIRSFWESVVPYQPRCLCT